MEPTVETLEIIGYSLNFIKATVTKIVKKFNDTKQFTNLYKATQTLLKTLKDKLEATFDGVGGVLNEVSGKLKDNDQFLLKDSISEVEKLFDAEVYNVAHIRKNFVTEVNRNFQYLISMYLARIKERSKALKAIAA